ncbi:MAG: helix-turn-helix domain-containing protein [Candidatus Sumerlaeia bacterium]
MESGGNSAWAGKSENGIGRKLPKSMDVAAMVESIVGCKWSVRILWLLAEGCCRPSAIMRQCPGLSAKVLNERLRKLQRFGIVERVVSGDKPPVEVKYPLTPIGRRFLRVLKEIKALQDFVDQGRASRT